MKKEILGTQYLTVTFDDFTKMYKSTYLPETENMTDMQWKHQMLAIKDLIEKYKPKFIIDDNRERRYSYPPDIQRWTLSLFVDSWNKIGLKKYVQIIPKEIIGKLTSQQIEEFAINDFKMDYEVRMVNDYESAMNWINE